MRFLERERETEKEKNNLEPRGRNRLFFGKENLSGHLKLPKGFKIRFFFFFEKKIYPRSDVYMTVKLECVCERERDR